MSSELMSIWNRIFPGISRAIPCPETIPDLMSLLSPRINVDFHRAVSVYKAWANTVPFAGPNDYLLFPNAFMYEHDFSGVIFFVTFPWKIIICRFDLSEIETAYDNDAYARFDDCVYMRTFNSLADHMWGHWSLK